MYTSDKTILANYSDRILKEGRICLAAAVFCAVFGFIYEMFSHEVYSAYMIFAFAIPLLAGAVPAFCFGYYAKRKSGKEDPAVGPDIADPEKEAEMDTEADKYGMMEYRADRREHRRQGICLPGQICRSAWNSGIAALTVGCIFRGVLEIYGTTNRLIVVYPVAAGVLMCIGAAAFLIPFLTIMSQ